MSSDKSDLAIGTTLDAPAYKEVEGNDSNKTLLEVPSSLSPQQQEKQMESKTAEVFAGRYELLQLLGEGGMGKVYRARDIELNDIVALKLLHPDLLRNEEVVLRFKQEVKLARRVTHRNVARTFDLGEHNGSYYLTMEFVEGEDLSALLQRKGRLAPDEVVRLGVAICEGLDAAHREKIIHRDLKPENILLSKDGRVMLTDFGIARLESGSTDVKTAAGKVFGTPTYMAPEQFEGKGEVDARTDLYALGCILFEMLTGGAAWFGDDFFVLATARFLNPPPDARSRKADVPDELAELVLKCMARHARDRFASAGEVIEALKQTGKHAPLPTGSLPSPSISPSRPWSTTSGNLLLQTPPSSRTVAVLPFRNGGQQENDYLTEGLMDDLIDTLSMTDGLQVRARELVLPYKDQELDPLELGRKLGVEVLVTGSLQKMGEQLRIRTRLLSTRDGNQLWGKRFSCTTGAFFETSDEIAEHVVEALHLKLEQQQRPAAASNTHFVDLYLRARHELRRSWNGDLTTAIQLFEEARQYNPDDPLVLSGAAITRARIAYWSSQQAEELESARILAERAYQLAPERPDAIFSLAMVRFLENRLSTAISLLEQALEHDPTNGDVHDLLGRILLEVGDVEKAVYHLRLGLSLNPALLSSRWDLMRGYAFLGRWDRIQDLIAMPVVETMDVAVLSLFSHRFALWSGNPVQGTPPPDEEITGMSSMIRKFQLICENGALSEEEITLAWEEIETTQTTRVRMIFSQILAEQLAFMERWEESLKAVQSAISNDLTDLNWLRHCPVFDPMRERPGFQKALQEMEVKIAPHLK